MTNETGTGNWEGWAGVLTQPVSSSLNLTRNVNTWGQRNLRKDLSYYTSFAGSDALPTNVSSAWQLSDPRNNTFTTPNTTTVGRWNTQLWRLASASETLKFKFLPEQTYYWQVGHRWWAVKNTGNATSAVNSEYLKFVFDGAGSMITGFVTAICAAIALI